MTSHNPNYYWDKIDECFRVLSTGARIEGNPPLQRFKIKNHYPIKHLRGECGIAIGYLQFNKVNMQLDKADEIENRDLILIDLDYLEELPT